MITRASQAAIELIRADPKPREKLWRNTNHFHAKMKNLGFKVGDEAVHPIVPIMTGEAKLAQEMSRALLDEGVFTVGFSYPVVPKGKARVRTQISAALSLEQIDRCVAAFEHVGQKLDLI